MDSAKYREQREHIIKLQRSLIDSGQLPTCTSCDFWDKTKEECTKWHAKPPIETILTGCVEYLYMPF